MNRPLTLDEVLARGLPARTIEHWIFLGLLRPVHRGRGTPRVWPQDELQIADLMGRLVDAGLTPQSAARAARSHVEGRPIVRLAPGVTLAIDTDLLAEAGDG
jgi:DNA-binding transcriptional MerR regulator